MKRFKGLLLAMIFVLPIIFLVNPTVPKAYYPIVSPIVLKGYNLVGSLPNSTIVCGTIFIPLRNIPELEDLAYQVSNPTSPLYGHFLTKQQVKELFYPADQYNKVVNYLKRYNISVVFSALDSVVVIRGTVQQLEEALGVNYYLYSNGTYS
ncbi:MAG: hypothetical protein JZD40_01770 [Sulfolobus sp.]|nr:hypothetical protein [Sulfolobus sp.]